MEKTRWALVFAGFSGSIVSFLVGPLGCIVMPGGPGIFLVPGIPSRVGRFFLFMLNVGLGLEEESVQGGRSFDANGFGEITAWAKASFEQILLHVVGRGNLDGFLVEPLDVSSERFFLSLNDGLEGGFSLWSASGCREVPRKYPPQLFPRSYGFAGEAFVPGHGSLP